MLPENLHWIVREFEPEGDAWLLFEIGRQLEQDGNLEGAATVYDRAFGLEPRAPEIRQARQGVLDQLAVVEQGLVFRYIPGGPFLMGWDHGEADERPWHPVWLSPYWMSEAPISWATYCKLLDWEPPDSGFPRDYQRPEGFDAAGFHLFEENKIRWYYCSANRNDVYRRRRAGTQEEEDQDPFGPYEERPMVAVSWQSAEELARHLSAPGVRFALPSEAQWEKAARGGLIGCRHAWGDDFPTSSLCDFNRFREFSIQPMKTFAPNDYGLYAMNGCVWEWTRDWYDREFYRNSSEVDPEGPETGEEKVLRGGSWADCADVISVTYRMSRESRYWRDGHWGGHETPNIGFRLCRMRE